MIKIRMPQLKWFFFFFFRVGGIHFAYLSDVNINDKALKSLKMYIGEKRKEERREKRKSYTTTHTLHTLYITWFCKQRFGSVFHICCRLSQAVRPIRLTCPKRLQVEERVWQPTLFFHYFFPLNLLSTYTFSWK